MITKNDFGWNWQRRWIEGLYLFDLYFYQGEATTTPYSYNEMNQQCCYGRMDKDNIVLVDRTSRETVVFCGSR